MNMETSSVKYTDPGVGCRLIVAASSHRRGVSTHLQMIRSRSALATASDFEWTCSFS